MLSLDKQLQQQQEQIPKQEKLTQTQILRIKEDINRISEEIEDKSFTVVEGIAYLIIGNEKNCQDAQERFSMVTKDYQALLNYIEEADSDYVKKKNELHAYFKQPPMSGSLKEKTLGDLERRLQIFCEICRPEEVKHIWDTVKLATMDNQHELEPLLDSRLLPQTEN